MKIKRRRKSAGGVGKVKQCIGYMEEDHWHMVTVELERQRERNKVYIGYCDGASFGGMTNAFNSVSVHRASYPTDLLSWGAKALWGAKFCVQKHC